VTGLSGSKRPVRIDFMDEDKGTPQKKLRDLVHVEQHHQKQ